MCIILSHIVANRYNTLITNELIKYTVTLKLVLFEFINSIQIQKQVKIISIVIIVFLNALCLPASKSSIQIANAKIDIKLNIKKVTLSKHPTTVIANWSAQSKHQNAGKQ